MTITYDDGIDPIAMEANIARGEALQAEAQAIAAETTVLRVQAGLSAVPAEQRPAVDAQLATLQSDAGKARRKATRLAVLSPLSEDDVNVERRGHLDEQVRAFESQHAQLTARIAHTEKLLALDGDNALTGDDRAQAEADLRNLRTALDQTTPIVEALQSARSALPPLPPEIAEQVMARRTAGGGPRRGPMRPQ